MSATEDPINPAATAGLPSGVLRAKNVAKKSTSKAGLSRNGSLSSGASSPVSLPRSGSASREASPEKKVSNLRNGNCPKDQNVSPDDDLNDYLTGKTDRSEDLKNGKCCDQASILKTEDSAEKASANCDEIAKTIIAEDTDNEPDAALIDKELEAPLPLANGVALSPKGQGSSESARPKTPDSESNNLKEDDSIPKEDADTAQTVKDPGDQTEDQTSSHSKKQDTDMLESEKPGCDSAACESPAEKAELLSTDQSLTLDDKAKDTIKEMLATAVSRIGTAECLTSVEDPDKSAPVEVTDVSSGNSATASLASDRDEDNSTEEPKSLEAASMVVTDLVQPDTDDKQSEDVPMETDTASPAKVIETQVEKEKDPVDSISLDSNVISDPPITNEEKPAPSADSVNAEAPENTNDDIKSDKQKEQDAELILLDGDDTDDNMEIIDESVLDEPGESETAASALAKGDSKPGTEDCSDAIATSGKTTNENDIPSSNKSELSNECDSAVTSMDVDPEIPIAINSDNSEETKSADESHSVATDSEVADKVKNVCEDSKEPDSSEKEKSDSGLVENTSPSDVQQQKETAADSDLSTAVAGPCKRHLSSSSTTGDTQAKRAKIDQDDLEIIDSPSSNETNSQTDNTSTLRAMLLSDAVPKTETANTVPKDEKTSEHETEAKPSLDIKPKIEDVKPKKPCSGTIKISTQALEKLIQRRIDAVLTSPNQSNMLSDMQTRLDALHSQLCKWKNTAKLLQTKITELTSQSRPDRRRAKGQYRHVAVQCEEKVQAAHGNHITAAKSSRISHAVVGGPSAPNVPVHSVSTSVAGASKTIYVPVASASANGSITMMAPSNLPPASANINSAVQYSTTSGFKRTVREMLDSSRAEGGTAGVSPKAPISQVVLTQQNDGKPASVKVIDLTDDDEHSPGKAAAPASSVIGQTGGLVVRNSNNPGATASNMRPGTYLVPVTTCQPIILQSIVNQQLRGPQGTTLVYTGARPGAPASQQILVPSTGQQLVTLPPGQTQIRPNQILMRQPTPQGSTARSGTVTKTSSAGGDGKSLIPAIQNKTAAKHPASLPPQPTPKSAPDMKGMAPKPSLKISRVPQGIVLSWNMVIGETNAEISNYQLFAYQEGATPPSSTLWKKVGEVKALPLPMACTLTQFQEGNKYHFAVRAVDAHSRVGCFSDPSSIHLESATSSS